MLYRIKSLLLPFHPPQPPSLLTFLALFSSFPLSFPWLRSPKLEMLHPTLLHPSSFSPTSIYSASFCNFKLTKLSLEEVPQRLKNNGALALSSTSSTSKKQVPEVIDRDDIMKRLNDMGFEEETIALLASKSNNSFVAQFQKVELLLKEGFTPVQVKLLVPNVLLPMSLGKLSKVLSFIKDPDVFAKDADKFLMLHSRVLSLSPANLQSKMEYLKGLGIDQKVLCRIVVTYPRVICRRSQALHECVNFLQQDLGVDKQGILKIISSDPSFFDFNVEKTLKPKVAILQSLGVPKEKIIKCLSRVPRAFKSSMEKFSLKVKLLQQLGFQDQSRGFSSAWQILGTLPSELISVRVNRLLDVGFSQSEVLKMVKSCPGILCFSNDSFSKKLNYLVNYPNRDMKEIVGYPQYFTCSLETRVIPRFDVLADMKKRGILKREMTLSTILSCSDAIFKRRFVDRLSKHHQVMGT